MPDGIPERFLTDQQQLLLHRGRARLRSPFHGDIERHRTIRDGPRTYFAQRAGKRDASG